MTDKRDKCDQFVITGTSKYAKSTVADAAIVIYATSEQNQKILHIIINRGARVSHVDTHACPTDDKIFYTILIKIS